LLGVDLPGAELLAFESLDSGAAGCFAFSGSVIDGDLLSLTECCGAGLELLADEGAGWSEEVLESDDGAAFVSGVAGVGGTEAKGAAGTDGDWTIGDWASAKMVAPVGIGA
jgi:hypothetical protein